MKRLARRKIPWCAWDHTVDYTRVQPGDALITFSKVGVLSVAEDLRQAGKKAAIIYGACPTPPGGGRWRLPGRGDAVCGGHRMPSAWGSTSPSAG